MNTTSCSSNLVAPKKLCIIQANCIGHQLRHLLMMIPAFADTYDVKIYTNFTKEPVPESELQTCALFIHQHLDEKWNDLASTILTSKVREGRCISIPSLFWRMLWPFWAHDSERSRPRPGFPYGRHPYGDSFIMKKIAAGVPSQEIVESYLQTNLKPEVDIDAIFTEDCNRECDREKHLDIKIHDYVKANFRDRRLMTSVNHPTNLVILRIVNELLGLLDMAPVGENILAGAVELGDYHVPVHPAVMGRLRRNLFFVGLGHPMPGSPARCAS